MPEQTKGYVEQNLPVSRQEFEELKGQLFRVEMMTNELREYIAYVVGQLARNWPVADLNAWKSGYR